jgi:alpha-1,3-rhamnosyl/mannosyltransferase
MKRIGMDVRKIEDFGIGTYISRLLERFATLERAHEFVLFGDPAQVRARFGDRFPVVPARSGKYSLGEQLELPRLAREQKLDLFHSPHYVVPVLSRCPLVVTVHDLIHLRRDLRRGFRNWLAAVYAKAMIGRAVRQARRVITVSDATRQDVEVHFPAARNKTVMIHNGAESPPAEPVDKAAVERFRERHQLGHPLLLFVGNPKPHKNLPAVLDTVAELRRRGRAVQLALAGSSPDVVLNMARWHGVTDAVKALGYLPAQDLPLVYHAADALLFPTLHEGFGLPALEAMAAGLPVVTSNVTSLPEVVGDAALTVNPRDIGALADAVVRVLDEPGLRPQLVARGYDRLRLFSWQKCAEAHLAIYQEVLYAC